MNELFIGAVAAVWLACSAAQAVQFATRADIATDIDLNK